MKTTLATPFTIPASVLQGVHALEGPDKQSRRRRWRVASLQPTCTVPPRGRAMSAHTASRSLRRPVRATRDSLRNGRGVAPTPMALLLRPGKGEVSPTTQMLLLGTTSRRVGCRPAGDCSCSEATACDPDEPSQSAHVARRACFTAAVGCRVRLRLVGRGGGSRAGVRVFVARGGLR
jgi:hypothetical protein